MYSNARSSDSLTSAMSIVSEVTILEKMKKKRKNQIYLWPCTLRFLETGRKWHNLEGRSPEQNMLGFVNSFQWKVSTQIFSLYFGLSLTSTNVADFALSSIWGFEIQFLGISKDFLVLVCFRIDQTTLSLFKYFSRCAFDVAFSYCDWGLVLL